MTLTLHDIKVWNTGEVIDLVVPSDTDASVDASAMTIAPGFEDPHVHFRDPGQTYKESMISGCAAAASGGYTNVLIMPNTVPAMDGVKVEAGQPGASEVLDRIRHGHRLPAALRGRSWRETAGALRPMRMRLKGACRP